jgi:nuclear transcription factor Y gamma
VNKGVTNGDAIPSDFQDAPVNQPPLSDHHQVASQQDDHCQQPLEAFWSGQLAEIKQTANFKTHSLPEARIKKIMKADADLPKRVAGEAPLLFAKACEMFIQELTLRAWLHTEEDKRRTLQKKDVTVALASTKVFDFLVADGSSDKPKGNEVGLPPPTTTNDDDPYADYYWDDYSPPWSPDEPSSPDLRNVTCDDPRYYTYIHDYYSL